MRRVLLLLLLLCLPATGSAMWALVPLEELVQESDLIVVGTLRDVSEHTADGVDFGEGRIEVREVIWGGVSKGDSLTLKWQNSSGVACPRVEHKYNAGAEGVWLLTRDGEAVRADYPGRFVGVSERGKVEAALARSPVVLRADRYRVSPGEPMRFSVVYRNSSDVPRTFPGLAFEGGRLRVGRGPRLAVTVTFDDEETYGIARLSGRVVRDSGLAPVAVPPRGEHRVELDLREMLTAARAEKISYYVTLKFGGLPRTNELELYNGEPPVPSTRVEAPKFLNVTNVVDYSAPAGEPGPARRVRRAALAAFFALLLFPFFHRLRDALGRARLARAADGAQTWQI
jgi:hypothetical protein